MSEFVGPRAGSPHFGGVGSVHHCRFCCKLIFVLGMVVHVIGWNHFGHSEQGRAMYQPKGGMRLVVSWYVKLFGPQRVDPSCCVIRLKRCGRDATSDGERRTFHLCFSFIWLRDSSRCLSSLAFRLRSRHRCLLSQINTSGIWL